MTDLRDQRQVFFAQLRPIVAMHVRDVEVVPIAAPDFVENLPPFLGGNAQGLEAGQGNGAGVLWLAADLEELELLRVEFGEDVPAVRGNRPVDDVLGDGVRLTGADRVGEHLRFGVLATEVGGVAAFIEQGFAGGTQIREIVRLDRYADHAPLDAVEVDAGAGSARSARRGDARLLFTDGEGVARVRPQCDGEDARVARRGEVKLDFALQRAEFPHP